MNRTTIDLTLLTFACLLTTPLQAANIAFDSAADVVYNDGWQASDNGGFGFTSWAFLAQSNSGHFLGSSTANGDGIDNGIIQGIAGDGDIDTAGRSWGLFSQGNGGAVAAFRQLTGGPLSIGQSIGIDMDNGGVDTTFFAGVQFLTNTDQILFRFHGGDPTYEVYTQNLTVQQQSALPFADEGLSLNLLRTGAATFDLKVTLRNGSSQTLSLTTLDGDVRGIVLQNTGAGASPLNNAYYNSMRVGVIPEPGSLLLTLLGVATLGWLRSHRN